MPAQPPAVVSSPPRPAVIARAPRVPSFSAAALPLRTSGLAVASLVCASFGLCTVVLAVPAVLMAHRALAQMRRDPFLRGRASARAALVLGYATLIVVGLVAITAWLGV